MPMCQISLPSAPWVTLPKRRRARAAARRSAVPRLEIVGDDVEAKAMKLSDYRGNSCSSTSDATRPAPCRAMYPYEKALVRLRAGDPFALAGFDVDADRTKLQQARKVEGITWAFLVGERQWSDRQPMGFGRNPNALPPRSQGSDPAPSMSGSRVRMSLITLSTLLKEHS